MSRSENGSPVHSAKTGKTFIVADAVAKLSGVSLGTVTRVIAAMDALNAVHGTPPYSIINHAATPLALADERRSKQCTEAVEEVFEAHRKGKLSPSLAGGLRALRKK